MSVFWQIVASNALVVTALAVGVALLRRAWRNPIGLHVLWVLVLVKLLTPPIWTVPLPWNMETASVAADRYLALPTADAAPTSDGSDALLVALRSDAERPSAEIASRTIVARAPMLEAVSWTTVLASIWGCGVVALAVFHLVRIRRFQRLLRVARPAAAELTRMAEAVGGQLRLWRTPVIWMLPDRLAPFVWSLGGAPRVYLPTELFVQLDSESQRAILAHELAHVRRRDHLVRLLELATTTLFWWHPVVWWARRELRELEEQCCDAIVLDLEPRAVKTYATALVDTLDFLAQRSRVAPAGATSVSAAVSLVRRISMLKNEYRAVRLTLGQLALLSFAVCLPMALAFAAPPSAADLQLAQPASGKESLAAAEPAAKPDLAKLLLEPTVGRNFIIVPITSDLQRAAGAKYKDAKVFVLINGSAMVKENDSVLDVAALDFKALRKAMELYIVAGVRGGAIFRLEMPVGKQAGELPAADDKPRADDIGTASNILAGFLETRAHGWFKEASVEVVSHLDWKYAGDWQGISAQLTKIPTPEQIQAETGVGDNEVRAYPVQTPLSRYLYGEDEDCVVHIIPPIDKAKPDLIARAQRAVADLKLKRNRVTFLYHWEDAEAANALTAKLFKAKSWQELPGFSYAGQMIWD